MNDSVPLPQTFLECERCGESGNISLFCKNCPCSLCEKCGSLHQTEHKQHTVIPRTNEVLRLFGPAKIAEQCRKHPEKEIALYCEVCNKSCCTTCHVENHQYHEMSTIEKKYIGAEVRLNDYTIRLEKEVMPTLDNLEQQAREKSKRDNEIVMSFIDDINDFRKEILHNFNKSCDDFISQVQQISIESNSRYLVDIENAKERVELQLEVIERKVQEGSLELIKYIPPDAQSFVPVMETPLSSFPHFIPNRKLLEIIRDSVGSIKYDTKANDFENEVGLHNGNVKMVEIVETKSFKSIINVTSMVKVDSNSAWVMYNFGSRMYLYGADGKIENCFKMHFKDIRGDDDMASRRLDIRGYNDMAIRRSGELIITCEDKKVRCVASDGAKRKVSILKDTYPYMCNGICLTDKENIVLCMMNFREGGKIGIYSADAKTMLMELRGVSRQGFRHIREPFRVVQNGKSLYVVNEAKNVVCLNKRDEVTWIYDGTQANLKESFCPYGISIDKLHNILVTDVNNNCIHYIDRDGHLLHFLFAKATTGVRRYRNVAVDNDTGELWLGTRSGHIVIAKYQS